MYYSMVMPCVVRKKNGRVLISRKQGRYNLKTGVLHLASCPTLKRTMLAPALASMSTSGPRPKFCQVCIGVPTGEGKEAHDA